MTLTSNACLAHASWVDLRMESDLEHRNLFFALSFGMLVGSAAVEWALHAIFGSRLQYQIRNASSSGNHHTIHYYACHAR